MYILLDGGHNRWRLGIVCMRGFFCDVCVIRRVLAITIRAIIVTFFILSVHLYLKLVAI